MKAWPVQPGVPAMGHVTANGFWHPGPVPTSDRNDMADTTELPQHLLLTEGPTRHPETQELGWVTTCDCDRQRQWWGDTVEVSRRPAEAHQRSAKRQDRRR